MQWSSFSAAHATNFDCKAFSYPLCGGQEAVSSNFALLIPYAVLGLTRDHELWLMSLMISSAFQKKIPSHFQKRTVANVFCPIELLRIVE